VIGAREIAERLRATQGPDAFAVAAVTGEGCAALLEAAGALVIELQAHADRAAPVPAAQVAASPGSYRVYRSRARRGPRAFALSREG
jgi:hypothetical protein